MSDERDAADARGPDQQEETLEMTGFTGTDTLDPKRSEAPAFAEVFGGQTPSVVPLDDEDEKEKP